MPDAPACRREKRAGWNVCRGVSDAERLARGQKLYGNSNVGATARSIKLEDFLGKIDSNYDYVENRTVASGGNGIYNGSYTVNGPLYIPSIWLQEKGQYNRLDGEATNGSLGISEQNELVTSGFTRVNSYATFTNGYLSLKSGYKNNMKTAETQHKDYDTEIYYELLTSGSMYLYASRANFVDTKSNDWGFGVRYGPESNQLGTRVSSEEGKEILTNLGYGLRFIVTLPASSINLEQGDGVEGNGWGIQ